MEETIKVSGPLKNFEDLFLMVQKHKGSDLFLQVHMPPVIRIAGIPKKVEAEPVSPEMMDFWARQVLPPKKYEQLIQTHEADYAFSSPGHGRMRINLFFQRGSMGLVARLVRTDIPNFDELNLPHVIQTIADLHNGLVIVSGVTGSGKSTTLAAMIEYINENRSCHILTIEDPIEYLYHNKKALINQREVGVDTDSFKESLRYAVRQSPDIILVGEMRDAETFEFALNAAETGHLVFGTLHSSNASHTIGRIIDLFPPEQHFQIRQNLQFNLKAVICQKLLPSIKESIQRVPAVEVMIVDATVRELIRKGEDIKIYNAIKAGAAIGMQDFNKSLIQLIKDGLISEETAMKVSGNAEALRMNLKGIFLDDDRALF